MSQQIPCRYSVNVSTKEGRRESRKRFGFLPHVALAAQQALFDVPAFLVHFTVDSGIQLLAQKSGIAGLRIVAPAVGDERRDHGIERSEERRVGKECRS